MSSTYDCHMEVHRISDRRFDLRIRAACTNRLFSIAGKIPAADGARDSYTNGRAFK